VLTAHEHYFPALVSGGRGRSRFLDVGSRGLG